MARRRQGRKTAYRRTRRRKASRRKSASLDRLWRAVRALTPGRKVYAAAKDKWKNVTYEQTAFLLPSSVDQLTSAQVVGAGHLAEVDQNGTFDGADIYSNRGYLTSHRYWSKPDLPSTTVFNENRTGTVLECYRPMMIEPPGLLAMIRRTGVHDEGVSSREHGTSLRNVKGGFTLRISLNHGVDDPDLWEDAVCTSVKKMNHTDPQFVRIIGLMVYDMGGGMRTGTRPQVVTEKAVEGQPVEIVGLDWSNEGTGTGQPPKYRWYAPSEAEIFEDFNESAITQDNAYPRMDHPTAVAVAAVTGRQYYSAKGVMGYKYLPKSTKETIRPRWREEKKVGEETGRTRKFHIFTDKKIIFQPALKVAGSNRTIARDTWQGQLNYSVPFIGLPDSTTHVNNATVRVFFYIFPSISNTFDGVQRTAGQVSTGHHFFTCAMKDEVCFASAVKS